MIDGLVDDTLSSRDEVDAWAKRLD